MSTITKQEMQAVADLKAGYTLGHADVAILNELARIALASLEAEPVAYVDPFAFNNFSVYRAGETDNKRMGREWMWANPDAGLIPVYTAPPAPVSVPDYPETLPCPVMLGPGLKFGKGVTTRTMLDALQRRAEYYAELEAMTPDERAEHDAGMKEFAAMLQGAAGNSPVIPDGWVACSERMPEDAQWCAVNTEYGYYVQCWSDDQGWLGDEISIPTSDVTHWIPLPAAPQQEVNNG